MRKKIVREVAGFQVGKNASPDTRFQKILQLIRYIHEKLAGYDFASGMNGKTIVVKVEIR